MLSRAHPILANEPKFTDDQRHAFDAEHGAPVFVEDDKRHVTYVLVSLRDFERLRPLFEEAAFGVRDSYPLQNAVAKGAGWDDPRMDAYDHLAVPSQHP